MSKKPPNANVLSSEIIRHFKVTEMPASNYMIPICNQEGKIITKATVNLQRIEYFWNGKKHKRNLFEDLPLYHSENFQSPMDWLILTIGIRPVWHLWSLGFCQVLGLLGKDLNGDHLKLLNSMVKKTGTLWVITDGNQKATETGVRMAGNIASLRFTRCLNAGKKRIIELSLVEIQRLFSAP
jgi:hypothetical protein